MFVRMSGHLEFLKRINELQEPLNLKVTNWFILLNADSFMIIFNSALT